MSSKTITRYIPIEKMSTRQYLDRIKLGLWGGVADPKVLEIIKNNKDNSLLEENEQTT